MFPSALIALPVRLDVGQQGYSGCQSDGVYQERTLFQPGEVAHACGPALWEAKVGRSPEVGVQDQLSQHGEIPSLLKIQKLARSGGAHL